MTQEHPITPPPELVQQWAKGSSLPSARITECQWQQRFARQAAHWGADQELEACVEWLEQNCGRWELPAGLRAARRPKPPSLKEQALEALDYLPSPVGKVSATRYALIRRALEALDD